MVWHTAERENDVFSLIVPTNNILVTCDEADSVK